MNSSLIKDTFREIRKTKSRFFSIFAIVAIGTGFFAGVIASAPVMRWNADRYFDDNNLMDYRIVSNFGITKDDVKEIKKVNGVQSVRPAYEKDVLVSFGSTQSVMRIHSLDVNHTDENDDGYINRLILTEGRLPRKSGEIVIESGKLIENSLKIGDEITISSGDGNDIYDTFKTTKYTIVGKAQSVYYLSYQKGSSDIGSGSVGMFAYVPMEDFDMDVYTEVFVNVNGAKSLNSYEDEYFDFIEPVTDRLETLGIERSDIRRGDILAEAQEKYDEGYQEYEDGLKEFDEKIAEAEQKIKDAENEILKGEIQLSTGKTVAETRFATAQTQIDTGKATLASLEEQYDALKKAYDDNYGELDDRYQQAKTELDDAKAEQTIRQEEYDAVAPSSEKLNELYAKRDAINAELEDLISNPEITSPDYWSKLDDIRDELEAVNTEISEEQEKINTPEAIEAKSKLDEANNKVAECQSRVALLETSISGARVALDTMADQIENTKKQIANGEKELAKQKADFEKQTADAEKKIEDGKKELEKGRQELAEKKREGQQELDDAYNELVKAQADIDAIEQAKWYILDRNSHYSYVDYRGATERMDAISAIFPVFFFLVAGLVCLTTMTRMVDEQRTQIGTMKALGYSTPQIAFKYVFYAAFASLAGSIIGLFGGTIAFPFIIYTAWNMMYILPPMQMYFIPSIMVLSALSSVIVTTGAAFAACYKELVETPSILMRPKTPKMGKKIMLERITPLWKRFSFTSKVTARNLFRYKKRFLMTVIGISGCTALLIAGFGIKDSIGQLVSTQFDTIFYYDGVVSIADGTTVTEKEKLMQNLKNANEIDDVYGIYMSSADVAFGDEEIEVTLSVITDTDNFPQFINLHNRKSKEEINLKSSGAVITEHTANQLKLSVGDEIQLTNKDGITKSVEITAICENYINHYVYMTATCYKNVFDLKASDNSLLVRISDHHQGDDAAAAKVITSYKEVDTVAFYTATIENFESMISSLNYIVIVLIISAGALAFVVLYNLTNVNVSERLREIATLKVLGFHENEVNEYVYRENLILTFIGSIVGLFMGKALHLAIMVMVELDTVMFGRLIKTTSYGISILITMLFAVVVNQVMKKRLANIPMVESLKSVE